MENNQTFDLETIKNRNCRDVVRQLLGKPARSTRQYDRYFSPFRQDGRKPSLTVYETGVKDFGGQGESWDTIGFVMAYLKVDFQSACQYLQGNANLSQSIIRQKSTSSVDAPSTSWQSATMIQLEKYERILWQSPQILDYLRHYRGLTDDTIRRYRLGYNPAWDQFRADGDLCKVAPGIVIPWLADDMLYAVRIRTRTDKLAQLAEQDDSYLGNKYMSITGSRQSAGLFGADKLDNNTIVIITEGEFDAMQASQTTGYHAITRGSAGDHTNITDTWLARLQSANIIYGLLDTDSAGQNATDALLSKLDNFIPLTLPSGKDITEYLLDHHGDVKHIFNDLDQASAQATIRRKQLAHAQEIEQKFYPHYQAPRIQATVTINAPFISSVSDQIPQSGVVVLCSDKGTGKTSYGKQVVKTYRDKYDSVMAITPFRSLTSAAGEQYQLEHYHSLTWSQWLATSNLAITLKSIGNFGTMGNIPTPKLVVLDEFSKMLEQLHSNIYHKNEASRVYTVLTYIIKQADQVLIMDADISDIEIAWLQNIRDDVHVVVNQFNRDSGKLLIHETRDSLRDIFIHSLGDEDRNQRPIAFFANTASEVQTLTRYLKEKTTYRILSIHSQNSSNTKQQAFLKNPDDHIAKYDAILISPSAMTGIDIQTQVFAKFGHFVYSPQHTPASSGCAQLLERARNADITHIWIEQANGTAEESADIIYETYRQAALRSDAMLMGLQVDDTGKLDLSGITKEIHQLQSQLIARDNISRNNLYENLLNLLARNYQIEMIGGSTALNKDEIKAVAKARKARWDKLVCTTKPIDDDTLDEAIANGNVTEMHYAGNARYHIEDFYNQTITPDLYQFDKDGKGRYRITNYVQALLMDTQELSQLDLEERENDTPLTARQFRAMKAKTIMAFINNVWGNVENFLANPVLTKFEIAEGTAFFLEDFEDDVCLYFKHRHDHNDDSWSIAKRLLRRFGLNFKQVRSRDTYAEKRYQIDPTTFEAVQRLGKQHMQGVTKKRNSNNNQTSVFSDVA